jgi:hypothetical protein
MSEYKRKSDDITLIQLSSYVKPIIKEHIGKKWVLNGDKNSFFHYIIDRRNGSVTNASIINVYCELLYGKGIVINGQNEIYKELVDIFPKREQQKCIDDYYAFGQYDMQILRAKGGGIAKIMHLPTNKLGMDKADENGDINGVWYCEDWTNPYKFTPEFFPAFKGVMNAPIMIKSVRPYQAGKFYFSDPSYLAALQYCEVEEETSNYSINNIKNSLSYGYIINFNNGAALSDEQKDKIEYKIREKLTGTSVAGNFILSFNDGKEAEVTVVPLEITDAADKYNSLIENAKQQILTAHGVTSPLLFGLPSATGFGSNADELDTASRLLQDYQVSPRQSVFIDELADILELAGLETDLVFLPLRETYKSVDETQDNKPVDDTIDEVDEKVQDDVKMKSHEIATQLIELGDDLSDDWEVIDERRCDEITLRENHLNTVFQFADTPKTSPKNSEQDTSLFKIRYRYAGDIALNEEGEEVTREFCRKVLKADKIYREEDLNFKSVYNEDLAPEGDTSYNVFLYKGGVNCQHWWSRVILLKKDNKRIGVNEARKMILQLEPEDRKDAKWVDNEKEVAVVASPSNNWWSLKPNYRNSGVTPNKK